MLVIAVGAALASLAAVPAFADPLLTIKLFRDSEIMFRDADMSRWADNYIELGAGYNSANSLRFGQFSGLVDKGGFPLAGFNWIARDQANDAQYWQIHGANLGLDSRKFKAEGGVQGRWDASLSFDGLKKSQTESAQFFHQGLGTSNLTLPAGFAAVANPTGVPSNLLRPFEIQHGRDIYRLGIKGLLGDEWDYKVNFREDRRDGTRITGMSFQVGGEAYLLPYQIDDKTQQLEAVLSYTSKIAQFQLGYTYSKFINNLTSFSALDPGTAANNQGRMSLAPDNDFHQINATGAYNFSKSTRFTATYSYGIARQNESFLPYSANGAAAAVALPRGSLDGKVVNTLLDVAMTTKPIDKMNLKVAYQYRDNDNRTPISQFIYASRDAIAVGTATNQTRTNVPMSTTEQKISLEGDYEIAEKTVLRAGLDHSDKKYTMADRANLQTNRLTVELRRPIGTDFLGSLGYIHTQRRGSDYDKNVYFRNTYTAANFQALNGLTNNPSMRQFLWSDYDENRLRTTGNWTVSETLSLQAVIDGYQQKMRGPNCGKFSDSFQSSAVGVTGALSSTCLGRDAAEGGSVSLDAQYQPEENLTTFAFANVSQTGIKQTGRQWTKGNTSGGLDTNNFYEDLIARDHTLGIGLKWQPEEKWDLGGTYVYNYGIGKTKVATSSGIVPAAQPLPDTWSKLHSVQLFAKWDYSKQVSWRFNYLYENLKSYDWAVSNVPAQGNTSVMFTGQQAPRYSNHVFGVSAVLKTW
jgi:MtrB/PioB family decaheme-associated outer membrane protein